MFYGFFVKKNLGYFSDIEDSLICSNYSVAFIENKDGDRVYKLHPKDFERLPVENNTPFIEFKGHKFSVRNMCDSFLLENNFSHVWYYTGICKHEDCTKVCF